MAQGICHGKIVSATINGKDGKLGSGMRYCDSFMVVFLDDAFCGSELVFGLEFETGRVVPSAGV